MKAEYNNKGLTMQKFKLLMYKKIFALKTKLKNVGSQIIIIKKSGGK